MPSPRVLGAAPGSVSAPVALWSMPALVALAHGRAAVIGARARRIAFGAALLVGQGILVVRALVADVVAHPMLPSSWEIVCITWLVALVSAGFAAPLMNALAPPAPQVHPGDDTLLASLVLPVAGLALFLPATLHMPIVVAVAGPGAFDVWCTRSIGLVAHAHVVLAVLAAHRAGTAARHLDQAHPRLTLRPREEMGCTTDESLLGPVSIYMVTLLVSAVPFGMAYVMPPLLAALTGLPVLALAALAPSVVAQEARLLTPHG